MSDGWKNKVILGDNLPVLRSMAEESVDLVYIDPPFNTGKMQRREQTRAVANGEATRSGFGGKKYETVKLGSRAWCDRFDDYYAFLRPRLEEAHRVLKPTGTMYFHIDFREVHYCKVLLDEIFGRDCFVNEIVWAYDYGGRAKDRWPAKHDNILMYAKDAGRFAFYPDHIDREPYMAPGLAGPEKAARGKLPTDVWWHTIVSPTGKEKTGWPTQKPLGVLRRIVRASSKEGDLVLDFFAGSGTTGVAAAELGRRFALVDANPEAVALMRERMAGLDVEFAEFSNAVEGASTS